MAKMQIEFRRSKPLPKIVGSVAIVLSMAALLTLRLAQDHIQTQTDQMRSQASQLEYENSELQEKINSENSVHNVERIAEEDLELADPDTIVIEIE